MSSRILTPAASIPGRPRATRPSVQAPEPQVVGNQIVDRRTGKAIRLLGVDVTGTEDACVIAGRFGWGPLDSLEAAAIASWDANVVRVPLNEDCWLGINGVPAAVSGSAYRAAIVRWVRALNAAGMAVVLDLHWSAPGALRAIGQWQMPDADHAPAFWTSVGATFASDPSVIFDLFNEPFLGRRHPTAADWRCWRNGCWAVYQGVRYDVAGMQTLVNAVRDAGAQQPIMLGGLNWAGDPCGSTDTPSTVAGCAWIRYSPSDSAHNLMASFHVYNWTICMTVSCWNDDVEPLAQAVPVVTGEVGEHGCSATFMQQYFGWADAADVSYIAWAWAGTGGTTRLGCAANASKLVAAPTSATPSPLNPQGFAVRSQLRAESSGSLAVAQ